MTRRLVVWLSLMTGITLGAAPWTPPRTAWGNTNLQGTWPGTAMMGVPLERPPQLGDKLMLSDEEFAARAAQAQRQAAADSEEFVAPAPAPAAILAGAGAGPPGHWGERGRPQRQTSLSRQSAERQNSTDDGRGPEADERPFPPATTTTTSGGGVFNGPEDLSGLRPLHLARADRIDGRRRLQRRQPDRPGPRLGGPPQRDDSRSAHDPARRPPARAVLIRSYMGDSRGRWDGTTLVVDTTNFNGRTGVGANGRAIYHSDALHVIERFTRTDADTIQYEATIDDPKPGRGRSRSRFR